MPSQKYDKEGEAGDTQEEDQAEESDTNRDEDREKEMIIEEVEENVEMARGDWPADSEGERRECCDLSNCCNIL